MKIPVLACGLLIVAATKAAASLVAVQEITVMTGVTEATVVGKVQVVPTPGEAGPSLAVSVLLPRSVTANFGTARTVAQPWLAAGGQTFRPTNFRISREGMKGIPRDWQEVVFFFHLPPQFAGRAFVGNLMYIQPQIKNVVPFLPFSTPAASASKVTFLPGNDHALELVSRNSLPAVLDEGMLTLQPKDRELILVRRLKMQEPARVSTEKKPPRRVHFLWEEALKGLFRRRAPAEPPATPAPSILPH